MKFSYNKRDNSKLFSSLEKKDSANISKIQNYIPLYNKFFTLNQSNYNNINLDNTFLSIIFLKRNQIINLKVSL